LTNGTGYDIITANDVINVCHSMIKKKTLTTVREIAEKAGVSVSTVSRALDPNRRNLTNINTRKKIEKVVSQSGFSFNLVARRFKRQKSEALTLVLPHGFFRKSSYADFAAHDGILLWEIIEGVIKEAKMWRYDVKIEPLFDSAEHMDIIGSIGFPHSDGALLFGSFGMSGLIGQIRRKKIPFLVLDTQPSRDYSIPEVAVDAGCGVREALEALTRSGHRDIAYLSGGSLENARHKERFNCFRTIMEEAGTFKDKLVFWANRSRDITGLLDNCGARPPFSAVLCSNDTIAAILIEKLEERGFKTPGDISVAGYNDNPVFNEGEKALSTVRIPRRELGTEAVRTLIGIIESNLVFEGKKLLPASFVQRKTTGAAPR
jgi:DNA-binding LacI/PurR family transcriptional regulator